MRPGEKLRFRGPNGAPFVVTVGEAFTPEAIQKYLDRNEWQRLDDKPAKKAGATKETPGPGPAQPEQPQGAGPAPVPDDGQAGEGGRPPVNAPKAEWIDYAVRQRALSREDAANFTKADLIEMFD